MDSSTQVFPRFEVSLIYYRCLCWYTNCCDTVSQVGSVKAGEGLCFRVAVATLKFPLPADLAAISCFKHPYPPRV